MTLLKRLQEKARDKFIQYRNDGYNGGKEGLRCSLCDQKYRGEAQMMQLCPVCQANTLITNTVTAVLDEIEREVEEHGNKVLGLYGGRLPYTFFGGNEEDNRMQIYLAAHKDIIKTIIKSKRTDI